MHPQGEPLLPACYFQKTSIIPSGLMGWCKEFHCQAGPTLANCLEDGLFLAKVQSERAKQVAVQKVSRRSFEALQHHGHGQPQRPFGRNCKRRSPPPPVPSPLRSVRHYLGALNHPSDASFLSSSAKTWRRYRSGQWPPRRNKNLLPASPRDPPSILLKTGQTGARGVEILERREAGQGGLVFSPPGWGGWVDLPLQH